MKKTVLIATLSVAFSLSVNISAQSPTPQSAATVGTGAALKVIKLLLSPPTIQTVIASLNF